MPQLLGHMLPCNSLYSEATTPKVIIEIKSLILIFDLYLLRMLLEAFLRQFYLIEKCFSVLQVVVSSYEAAISLIIEFDMDNSIFGLPREFVVASAGEHVCEEVYCNECRLYSSCDLSASKLSH